MAGKQVLSPVQRDSDVEALMTGHLFTQIIADLYRYILAAVSKQSRIDNFRIMRCSRGLVYVDVRLSSLS